MSHIRIGQKVYDVDPVIAGHIVCLEDERDRLENQRAFNADWERMYCATGHERISYIGETCPLCKAEAEVERLNEFCHECQHLDGWTWCTEMSTAEQREHGCRGPRDHCHFVPSRWQSREEAHREP